MRKTCGVSAVVKCCVVGLGVLRCPVGSVHGEQLALVSTCTKHTNTHIGCFYKKCFFHLFLLCLVFIVFKLVILLKKKIIYSMYELFLPSENPALSEACCVICQWSSASQDSSALGTHTPSLLPAGQSDRWVTKIPKAPIPCPSREPSLGQGIGA